jgi:hypothetical protein
MFTTTIPKTINNRASRRLEVIGSPRISHPSNTPAIGMIKIKECNETVLYF